MTATLHTVQMFSAYFIFAAPAIVLSTEARLGFFLGIFQFLIGTFVAKFPGKETVTWERGCTFYTRPQGHLRFQDGGRAVCSESRVRDVGW